MNQKIPRMVTEEILKIGRDPLVILFLINGFLLIAGCFMSILVPVIKSLAIDPVAFGVLGRT